VREITESEKPETGEVRNYIRHYQPETTSKEEIYYPKKQIIVAHQDGKGISIKCGTWQIKLRKVYVGENKREMFVFNATTYNPQHQDKEKRFIDLTGKGIWLEPADVYELVKEITRLQTKV